MSNRSRTVAIVLCFILWAPGSLVGFHDGDHGDGLTEKRFKVNKLGEVNIGTDVRMGTYLVKRGKYMLTHRVAGERHLFVLEEIKKKKDYSRLAIYELDSRFITDSKRVKSSALLAKELRDHSYEVVNIELVGEDGDHVVNTGRNTPIQK